MFDLQLKKVINLSGTMTSLGSSMIVDEAFQASQFIRGDFVVMDELHEKAGREIARHTKSEYGFITSSASAGITLTIAASMTGRDLGRIEKLPNTMGLKNEVVLQMGHVVNYGSSIQQNIQLSGAKPSIIGTATKSSDYQLISAINEKTACAIYVVSHHCVSYGQIPLEEFCLICMEKNIPVIVDAASEYDLKKFHKKGVSAVIHSGHKFLGGPTSGIVSGKKDFVYNTFLQNKGIGRAMKIGKENIMGVLGALSAWEKRNHEAIYQKEQNYLKKWKSELDTLTGVYSQIISDPTNNPLKRLEVIVDEKSIGKSAQSISNYLKNCNPAVFLRDHEIEHGKFYLDPCNLKNEEEANIAIDLLVNAFQTSNSN